MRRICFHKVIGFLKLLPSVPTCVAAETPLADGEFL